MKKILFLCCVLFPIMSFAQTETDELDKLLGEEEIKPELVSNAFKSSRVINSHSMEMIGEGVLDFRILHRFGIVKNGLKDLFGLDQASMRMGFDYGITKDLTVGIGRSTYQKEIDGFVKYRLKQQRKNTQASISLVLVSGMTLKTVPFSSENYNKFSNRLGYYHQIILGRKFTDQFTLQVSPTYVHRNLVDTREDFNSTLALGIGARYKLSGSTALILDTQPILYGRNRSINKLPLSIGLDIETGGHVFQLHFSNAQGMNEKAFITETYQDWAKSEFQFGFNLSRVFTVKQNQNTSW